jgi:ATP-binding cassette subfamily B protein
VLPIERSIDFDNVSYSYAGRDRPALRGVNLSIPRGSRVAIVGATGSGKSTLADLLMGLIEPTGGQVRVDGALLAGPALAAWRQSVAHVPQAIFLADTSIAQNIALGCPDDALDMPRIEQAARTAQLHDFIMSLPDGYSMPVGEAGVRLSGGQRQRLGLARAIYKQAPMLILDEATSALDEATEEAVLSALDALHARGHTIVIIAHRLSTVQRCDRIFLLDDGQLLQAGSFTELFGRLNRLHEQGAL